MSTETKKKTVEITFDGKKYDVPDGISINEASQICLTDPIPTLCHHPYLPHSSFKCGVCFVKDENTGELVRSCEEKVGQGMKIDTKCKDIEENIKASLKRKLSIHPLDCANCDVDKNCSFQKLLNKYKITPSTLSLEQRKSYNKHYIAYLQNKKRTAFGNNSVVIDDSKCIQCYRCIRGCHYIQCMSSLKKKEVITSTGNLDKFDIEELPLPIAKFDNLDSYHEGMFDGDCIQCGQCSFVCPAGAITVNSAVKGVDELLKIKKDCGFVVIAQTAPSVRITLSEEFGGKTGLVTEDQLVNSLRKLGFEYVFDTQFTADLTIMEEGTDCCPAWINFVEKHAPEFRKNLSTCKSPQQMMGSLIKHYWAEKKGIEKTRIVVVSIMPSQMLNDVDFVLTTREYARLLKQNNINPLELKGKCAYDDPLGKSTGAAVIFGATGGVMEAAVRTAYQLVVGKPLPNIDYVAARGLKGIKTADIDLNGTIIKVAIAHSGGCIGGGGNPKFKKNKSMLQNRLDAVYGLDKSRKIRKSHENPAIKKIYEEFFINPLGYYSKKLLHTYYTDRKEKEGKKEKPKIVPSPVITPAPVQPVQPVPQVPLLDLKAPKDSKLYNDYLEFIRFEQFQDFSKKLEQFEKFKKFIGGPKKKIPRKAKTPTQVSKGPRSARIKKKGKKDTLTSLLKNY